MLYWAARSSSELTGEFRREMVRKAAKLAVYEAMMMKPNSHQLAVTRRPDRCFGVSPPPCVGNKMPLSVGDLNERTAGKPAV